MSIYQGSRYEYSVIDFVSIEPDADANAIVFYEFDDIGVISYREHTYKQGERVDNLAFDYYQDPNLWWVILDANPEIEDPTNIATGTVIRIPNV
jgi:nucleoid-associated protein YgaU